MAVAISLVAAGSSSATAELLVPISTSDTIVNTSVDDSVFGTFNIGFAFPFFGSVRETVNMSSNGNLQSALVIEHLLTSLSRIVGLP